MNSLRYTSKDLETFPQNDGKRYEIIDGDLYVSTQPHWNHQIVSFRLGVLLDSWSRQNKAGLVNTAPGLIFAEDDDAAPDIVWISHDRFTTALEADGKLHSAPELVVEILSPGGTNEKRDREVKRKLYSRRGVDEYWIVSWPKRQLEVYWRDAQTLVLDLVYTLYEKDTLTSPNLPGFTCRVEQIFQDLK